MLLHRLKKDGLINPPSFLCDNTQYVAVSGSVAYGVSGDMSDMDCYGWAYTPKEVVFPHSAGYVVGFGTQPTPFRSWQQHDVRDEKLGKHYDFQIYGVVAFFDLLMQNNPNMVDCLFVPQRCVLHASRAAQLVRENRKMFLHGGSYHKFKGYAYAQLKKLRGQRESDFSLLIVREFEDKHNIDHTTSMEDIRAEMRRRGLSA